MTCPLKFDCKAVVTSEYARFFGIPLEYLGILYYGGIMLTYSLFLLNPDWITPLRIFLLTTFSIAAFCFSVYLTFIQAVALKQWCSLCLASAALSTLIFVITITGNQYGFLPLLEHYKPIVMAVHLIGVALGVGGATATDIFFFTFLKDFRISKKEKEVLDILSQIIWLGLALLVVSGLGLYLPQMELLNETPKFLVKVIVTAVILVNGAALNIIIAPKMMKISFGGRHRHRVGELVHLRKLAFGLGAISITSWYAALILGVIPKNIPLSFSQILIVYILVALLALTASQIYEQHLARKEPR